MLDNLSSRLGQLVKTMRGHARLTEDNIKDALREVRMALLEADVALPVVKDFVAKVKEKAMGQEVLGSLTPGQAFIGVVNDSLTDLMGKQNDALNLAAVPPAIILMAGLQGAGKTTTIGKLAYNFKNAGKEVLLGAADPFRAGAVDQLTIWSERTGVPIVKKEMGSDPASVTYDTVISGVARKSDVIIIDTAGRLHNKLHLMEELTKMKRVIQKVIPDAPHEVLLVLDGSTGQNALEQAKHFTAATDVTALAITKLDGTAKGGVVIAIANQFNIPVKFIGVGEQAQDLLIFDKEQFVNGLF